MSALRTFAFCLAMLAAGAAGASDRTRLQVSLVLVDACTVHSPGNGGADPGTVQVECSSAQPYRVDARGAERAPTRTGLARPGEIPGLTVTF
ncbi:hypothetical protein [Luteimonas sp. MC1572]|uniref:hypothetical protein n=1 Tax=Luteimonas sp. MC1572 TaxID=2799325 RepID=UPI0018F0D536|nr:hypothetical protein [Luteimonas sp. MC1572]MBJ6980466.1 hypothetical protein [Luteimonas sp. MC1572]QQO04345.1 hypothetical protein JGR64_06295 [Luteimonas sp. MC1572]